MGRVYYQYVDVTDFGPYVTKVILGMPRTVKQEELSADQFSVYVEMKDKAGEIVKLPLDFLHRDVLLPSVNYREIKDIYPSCRFGNRKAEGEYVTIEMPYGPIYNGSATIAADYKSMNGHEYYTFCDYTITQLKPIGEGDGCLKGLLFNRCAGIMNPKRERFTDCISSYEALPLKYGYFVPEMKGGKKPLIIFLHGAGEGGQETAIAYSGNKVTAFTEKDVQETFGGAFVLAPQCPTMWMDDGSGQYGHSGISKYTEALKALIDEFISRFDYAIDMDRIYVGGDSNGGFMTMRMLMSYPDFFAAAYPICEAMIDTAITDDDIANMVKIPIWFTHAKNDPVVVPKDYVLPTYERLVAAGHKNLHFTFWDKIEDLHGEFKKANGEPWEYMGHFAWIPMLNNDCRVDFDGSPVMVDGKEAGIMEWLAAQHR